MSYKPGGGVTIFVSKEEITMLIKALAFYSQVSAPSEESRSMQIFAKELRKLKKERFKT